MLLPTGSLQVREVAAPSTPTTGLVVAYAKTDGLWYGKDDAGVERLLSHSVETFPVGKVITGVYTGTFQLGFTGAYTFESCEVRSDVAITGNNLVFDILKGGTTTIWSTGTNRPTIAVGQQRAVMAGAPSSLTVVDGDFYTFSIVAPAPTNASINLQAVLRMRRTA
jgi:hypothetical protein